MAPTVKEEARTYCGLFYFMLPAFVLRGIESCVAHLYLLVHCAT